MDRYKKQYKNLPNYPVGDAGYGSFDNYAYCLENGIELDLKSNYFNKFNYDNQFKRKIFHTINLKRRDVGIRICPRNHFFDIYV